LYPGLKNGLRSKNELVRAEVLGVIAHAVTKCGRIDFLREMQVLLAGGDEEANFFNNIHHVQIHRRTRALRRLGDQCDDHHLRSTTLAEIFVPLVSNYIVTPASLDHHLINEAIITTGRMAKQLAWGAYYALVQRYLKSSRDRDESERVYVRTLVAVLENFHFPMEQIVPPQAPEAADDVDADSDELDGDPENPFFEPVPPVPVQPMDIGKIVDAVNLRLLPNLLHHLEKRDVTEDSLRIPISIGIVKVAKHLPEATREPQVARLLTILSQILRSKSQETRDLTRDTLCRIVVILGSPYLPVMLREMRGALLRGPQLHVLAYVAHALLAYVTTSEYVESFQILDGCVTDVTHISAEVVFGESGKDVQSEGFKTKMREVRSSSAKGLDSFAIMAKYVTPSNISGLLSPLRSIMQETQSVKTIQLVEEVLRRVASGLNANKHLAPEELLVLCHTLISQNARFLKEAPSSKKRKGNVKVDAIVQNTRQVLTETDHYGNNSFR
jgi:U3 small nucleolar RNA-associated protein 20